MDKWLQKDLNMIVLRSQNPPRITFGKTTDLDLNMFMHVNKPEPELPDKQSTSNHLKKIFFLFSGLEKYI